MWTVALSHARSPRPARAFWRCVKRDTELVKQGLPGTYRVC
jgi:hypothetical protein